MYRQKMVLLFFRHLQSGTSQRQFVRMERQTDEVSTTKPWFYFSTGKRNCTLLSLFIQNQDSLQTQTRAREISDMSDVLSLSAVPLLSMLSGAPAWKV